MVQDDENALYRHESSVNSQVESEPSVANLKEKGNTLFNKGNYAEALEQYNAAIRLCPKDHTLYSNRSLAFLKLKQYFHANRDAETVIQLNPTWAKGHFRKAEVMLAVGHYDLALLYYGRAIQIQPDDRTLLLVAQKAAKLSKQQELYERRLPWVGAGIGIIVGVIITLSDRLLKKSPTLNHPALMVFLVMIIACLGYVIALTIRYLVRLQKKGFLEPSYEDAKQETEEQAGEAGDQSTPINRARYTKAQARQRFRKGKS